MKRSPMPPRKKPMKRTEMKRSTVPMKRTRLKPISDHRREVNIERARLQEKAWGPRPWKCEFPDIVRAKLVYLSVEDLRCFGKVDGHEILSRAQAGQTDENLLDVEHQLKMCSHHNTWIDLHKEEAEGLGLRRSWQA